MNKAILSERGDSIAAANTHSKIINIMFSHTTYKVIDFIGDKHFSGTATFSISK